MSESYTDMTLLATGVITTPTDDVIYDWVWSSDKSFLVTAVQVLIITAGAQAASELFVETQAGTPVVLAQVAMGTSVAQTKFQVRVTDALALQAAGTVVRMRHNTTDASLVYRYKLWGTFPQI